MKFLLLLALGVIAASAEYPELYKDFVLGNNLFAADVYTGLAKEHSKHSDNFLVCPLSVEIILGLAHNGAGGKTAEELAKALHFPNDKTNLQERIQLLAPHLEGTDKYTLNSANKIYVKDGFKFQDQFKSNAVNIFKADIQSIDFENQEQAANEMNGWVEEKTLNKIKDLINKDDLNEDTRTVLINAMYFHGKWVHAFPVRATSPKPFYLPTGKEIQIEMMQQLNLLNYFECPTTKAQFLELPYEGDDVTLTIVLPKQKDGLPTLEADIYGITSVEHKFEKHLVELKLPKFEIKTSIEFKPIMEGLGVVEAFKDDADFNGILVNEPLKIDKIIQKAFMEVEEHGTVASAASAVEMPTPMSSNYVRPKVTEVTADHPFIFFIKIKGFVFFVGRYTGVEN